MVDRINTSHLPPQEPPQDPTHLLSSLGKQLHSELSILIEQLQQILKDPSLTEQSAFLQPFASNGLHLHETLHQISQLHSNPLKESAEILGSIFNQHLQIVGITEEKTLMEALENFQSERAEISQLSKALGMFATNPDLCETLIQELRLIAHDLKKP